MVQTGGQQIHIHSDKSMRLGDIQLLEYAPDAAPKAVLAE